MGQLYGRPAETVISRGRLELFPSAGELGIFDACLVALRTRQRIEFEVPWFQENGITGAFRLSAAPFGEFLLVTARDITGEMLAEAALAESQRQYQLLAQSATDVTFRTARNATLEWVSPSVAAVLGLGPRIITTSHNDRNLVAGIIALADRLGMSVTARWWRPRNRSGRCASSAAPVPRATCPPPRFQLPRWPPSCWTTAGRPCRKPRGVAQPSPALAR